MTATLHYGDRVVSLTPQGYEFGDPERALVGVNDARWLMMEIEAGQAGTTWKRVDACLSDAEAAGLVRWLRGLGAGDNGTATFEGVEPSLQFRARWQSQMIQLEVLLNLELHPDGRHFYDDADPKILWFEVPQGDIERFADELDQDLRAFPYPRP